MGDWARPGTAPPTIDRAAGARAPTSVRRVAQAVRSRPPGGSIARVDWGFIWLMFALKIPLIALLWLVWWAVHATPETDAQPAGDDDGGTKRANRHPRNRFPRRPRRGPHGAPAVPAPPRTRSVVRARGRHAGLP